MAYAAMPMFFWPAPAIPRRKVLVDITAEAARNGAERLQFIQIEAQLLPLLPDA